MHPLYEQANNLSYDAIGAAMEVHRIKGPGLIESIYERCLARELELRKIETTSQKAVQIDYKGITFEEPLRFGILLDNCLLLALKAVPQVLPIHRAQLLSYLRLLDIPLGLIINFHEVRLKDGIHRLILPGADQP